MPKRIQRKRTRGWKMPDGAVYVGRPTVFGNPFTGKGAVETYRRYLTTEQSFTVCVGTDVGMAYIPTWHHRDDVIKALEKIRGKDLACFCPLHCECHADVLLELANA